MVKKIAIRVKDYNGLIHHEIYVHEGEYIEIEAIE